MTAKKTKLSNIDTGATHLSQKGGFYFLKNPKKLHSPYYSLKYIQTTGFLWLEAKKQKKPLWQVEKRKLQTKSFTKRSLHQTQIITGQDLTYKNLRLIISLRTKTRKNLSI
jgi:hypothetical protein